MKSGATSSPSMPTRKPVRAPDLQSSRMPTDARASCSGVVTATRIVASGLLATVGCGSTPLTLAPACSARAISCCTYGEFKSAHALCSFWLASARSGSAASAWRFCLAAAPSLRCRPRWSRSTVMHSASVPAGLGTPSSRATRSSEKRAEPSSARTSSGARAVITASCSASWSGACGGRANGDAPRANSSLTHASWSIFRD
mmetsp:Transcript_52352/g.170276  ORF Transcript_52352/g.170276 Transcript_52352/m.170276 type:complete len:201 (+) Transcript_52352:456-1058(+)